MEEAISVQQFYTRALKLIGLLSHPLKHETHSKCLGHRMKNNC